jgi:hypothetical protein
MWKTIPGHLDYEVSEVGEVRSLDRVEHCTWKGKPYTRFRKGCVLKPTLNKETGYLTVHLGRKCARPVHQLVAWAFLGPQDDGALVRHRDGDSTNNHWLNLQYGTGGDNYKDAICHGTAPVGEKHYAAVLTEEVVRKIRCRADAGVPVAKVAREFDVKYATALAVVKRKTWGWLT